MWLLDGLETHATEGLWGLVGIPMVKGCVERVWPFYNGGIHLEALKDDCCICGGPPNVCGLQGRREETRNSPHQWRWEQEMDLDNQKQNLVDLSDRPEFLRPRILQGS